MIAILLSSLLAAHDPGAARRALPEPARGVVLGLHDSDPRRSYVASVAEIAAIGANALSIMPIWTQPDVRSARVLAGPTTAAQIDETVAAARAAGLAILLAPILHVEDTKTGEWRGTIQPPDWDQWFASYRGLLLALARRAEQHRVEALLVGSELCSSEVHEGRWRALIVELRTVFHGQLVYQTNWDHRATPRFLDALDVVGSNAYFEIGRGLSAPGLDAPKVDELVRAWAPVRDELLAWSRGWKRPLLLTEVGFPSLASAASFPWDYTRDVPLDLEAQRGALEAFFQAWDGARGLGGVFIYEWWGEGGPRDRGYTPRGKPAERVLRQWFASGHEPGPQSGWSGTGSEAGQRAPVPRERGR